MGKATALSCTVVSTLTAASDEAAMVLVARPVCTVRLKGEFTALLPNPVQKLVIKLVIKLGSMGKS